MLTTNDFAIAMEILVNSLPTPAVNKRVEGLYHFFKNESYETILAAAEEAARSTDRFPVPSVFAEIVRKHRTKTDQAKSHCDFCGGVGMVTARDAEGASFAFRCHCPNAAGFQKIPAWTKEHRQHYQLIEYNPFQDLYDNPELYRKGLKYITTEGEGMPKEIRQAIEKRIGIAEQAKARRDEPPPF